MSWAGLRRVSANLPHNRRDRRPATSLTCCSVPSRAAKTLQQANPLKPPLAARREVITIFTRAALREGDDLSAADSTYVAQMVSAQTGMSQVDADKRVAEVTKQAKEAADQARKAAASCRCG